MKNINHKTFEYNNTAVDKLNSNNTEVGRQLLEKALEIDKNYSYALYNKANLLSTFGKFDEALQYYELVIEKKPDYSKAYNNIGELLFDRDLIKALHYFERAIFYDENDPIALENKEIVLRALGRKGKANKEIIKNKKREGDSFFQQGEKVRAVNCYEEAIQLYEELYKTYYIKDASNLENQELALTLQKEADKIQSGLSDLLFYKGKILKDIGRNEESLKSLD